MRCLGNVSIPVMVRIANSSVRLKSQVNAGGETSTMVAGGVLPKAQGGLPAPKFRVVYGLEPPFFSVAHEQRGFYI